MFPHQSIPTYSSYEVIFIFPPSHLMFFFVKSSPTYSYSSYEVIFIIQCAFSFFPKKKKNHAKNVISYSNTMFRI